MTHASALLLSMFLLTMVSGCAGGPPIDKAIATHNIFRSVLLDIDAVYKPSMDEAQRVATEEANGDSAKYMDAIQPWLDAVKAITFARQAEQAMHLALQQWIATGKEAGVLQETYSCAAEAVDQVATAFAVLPRGSPLYAAAFAISTQLRAMADDHECGVKP